MEDSIRRLRYEFGFTITTTIRCKSRTIFSWDRTNKPNMSRVIFAGPSSSTSNWKPTHDSGKHAPSSKSTTTDGFRVTGDITGPTSSHRSYTATEDSGKYARSCGTATDGFRVAGDVAGPTSSHGIYTATEDGGKFLGAKGSDGFRALDL